MNALSTSDQYINSACVNKVFFTEKKNGKS